MRVHCENYQVQMKAKKKAKKKRKKVAVALNMGCTLFHEAAVKGHLEICQTILWSLVDLESTNQ